MKDYLNIGPSPAEEVCAQMGGDIFSPLSRIECAVFGEQIARTVGAPPGSARIISKSFSHDFGSYREVCVSFDDEDEAAVSYAFQCESDAPGNWDDAAKAMLDQLCQQSFGMTYAQALAANGTEKAA